MGLPSSLHSQVPRASSANGGKAAPGNGSAALGRLSPGSGAGGTRRRYFPSSCGMEVSSHHSRLLQQLNEQRKQDLFCDCSILVEGKALKAHRNVLFASSGYFKMLLSQSSGETSPPTTATFEVFSPETFNVILDFVYTGRLSLDGQTVIEVMSAASYLQMTDVIGACKTFIKSSLDINEKEQDCFFTRSNQDTKSNGVTHSSGYSDGWRAELGLPRPQPAPDHVEFIVASSSWGNDSRQPSSQMSVQQQEPYSGQPVKKWGILKKRQCQLAHLPDTVQCKSRTQRGSRAGSRASEGTTHISLDGDTVELDVKAEPAQDGYLHGQDTEMKPLTWPPSQQDHDSPKAEHAMENDLYSTLPPILDVVGGWGEDGLPRVRFKCPFCTHTVKRRADLKRHLRCHTGERPYPCQGCGKSFTRLEHVRAHFQTIHEAGKLVCRKCKCHVTDDTRHVVQQGTRRYRLCDGCLEEAGVEVIPIDLNEEETLSFRADEQDPRWLYGREHGGKGEMGECGSPVIHEVEDSDDDHVEETEMKADVNKLRGM